MAGGDVGVLPVVGSLLGSTKWLSAAAHSSSRIRSKTTAQGRGWAGCKVWKRSTVGSLWCWWWWTVGGGLAIEEEHRSSNHSGNNREGERERRNGELVFLFLCVNGV